VLDYAGRLVTGPAIEPVTVVEAKRHANVVATDDDALVASLIAAARELVEEDTSRALINQTWAVELHDWWTDKIELPRPPLVSITSVKYFDVDGVEQTLAATNYDVDTRRQPGVIWWDEDVSSYPTLSDQANAVVITYVCGYGAAATAVPARAKQAILLLVSHWYRYRDEVSKVGDQVAATYARLINSLRVGVYP
jgi:uncharacterized phiE125 gp8 family phage protein